MSCNKAATVIWLTRCPIRFQFIRQVAGTLARVQSKAGDCGSPRRSSLPAGRPGHGTRSGHLVRPDAAHRRPDECVRSGLSLGGKWPCGCNSRLPAHSVVPVTGPWPQRRRARNRLKGKTHRLTSGPLPLACGSFTRRTQQFILVSDDLNLVGLASYSDGEQVMACHWFRANHLQDSHPASSGLGTENAQEPPIQGSTIFPDPNPP